MNGVNQQNRSGLRSALRLGSLLAAALLLAACDNSGPGLAAPQSGAGRNVASAGCADCHAGIVAQWSQSLHANTQLDVADELSGERTGETPEEVLHGADPENCIACHGATATAVAGNVSEADTMAEFFTTTGGRFTSSTTADNMDLWPHVTCFACHEVADDHPAITPALALFDSRTGSYVAMDSASKLCGQCHGSLRFPDTDHLTYDAWSGSGHNHTQQDVAAELAEARVGETASEVINGADPENCIACHGPTAVLANGGMTQEEALAYFFTTVNAQFTAATAATHTNEWPGVACTACHDKHSPSAPAYFNSALKGYTPVADSGELCGQCHGSLRFPDTDHRSYDILTGTGGIGVPDQKTMGAITCTDCHMFVSSADGSNSSMFHGHSLAITVTEAGGGSTTSCTSCHATMDTAAANGTIASFKSSFEALFATTDANVTAAAAHISGTSDPVLLAKLDEAEHNLEYASFDESGGFHNHNYLMALLEDANARALELLATP